MGRKQKKYHYIYKTVNVLNDKYYIGMHSTDNLNDGYIGSGKRLWNSINYHGKDNHVCEILEYCKDRKELIKREEEIVNEQLLLEDLCMNLRVGGSGGFKDEAHRIKCSEAGNKAFKFKFNNDLKFKADFIKSTSEARKKAHFDGKYKNRVVDSFKGKTHSEETKLKMSESKKGQGKGETNSQFGTCWITNEKVNKKIQRGDLLPSGFRLGRKN